MFRISFNDAMGQIFGKLRGRFALMSNRYESDPDCVLLLSPRFDAASCGYVLWVPKLKPSPPPPLLMAPSPPLLLCCHHYHFLTYQRLKFLMAITSNDGKKEEASEGIPCRRWVGRGLPSSDLASATSLALGKAALACPGEGDPHRHRAKVALARQELPSRGLPSLQVEASKVDLASCWQRLTSQAVGLTLPLLWELASLNPRQNNGEEDPLPDLARSASPNNGEVKPRQLSVGSTFADFCLWPFAGNSYQIEREKERGVNFKCSVSSGDAMGQIFGKLQGTDPPF
ncbi:hypothetical protein NL676_009252 [Syzygium grande]|nr:hypothetical protein NL676_009252 [Syzygium grande]